MEKTSLPKEEQAGQVENLNKSENVIQENATVGIQGKAENIGGTVNQPQQQAGQINVNQGQYGQVSGFVGNQVNGVNQQAGQVGNIVSGQINGNQGQYGQVSGFVGNQVNEINQQAGYFGNNINEQVDKKLGVKEDAGSIAGALETPGKFGYVGGFFGQQSQQPSEYAGGYIEQPQEQVLKIGYDVTLDNEKTTNLPAKQVGFLQKIKEFFLPAEWTVPEIRIGLTDKEVKVLSEIHDFLFQDISFKGFMNILKIGKNK